MNTPLIQITQQFIEKFGHSKVPDQKLKELILRIDGNPNQAYPFTEALQAAIDCKQFGPMDISSRSIAQFNWISFLFQIFALTDARTRDCGTFYEYYFNEKILVIIDGMGQSIEVQILPDDTSANPELLGKIMDLVRKYPGSVTLENAPSVASDLIKMLRCYPSTPIPDKWLVFLNGVLNFQENTIKSFDPFWNNKRPASLPEHLIAEKLISCKVSFQDFETYFIFPDGLIVLSDLRTTHFKFSK